MAAVVAMRLMLLEDFGPFARLVKAAFPDIEWVVLEDAGAAVERIDRERIDGVVLDVHLPFEASGMRVARRLSQLPKLVLTADRDPSLVSEAHELGVAIDYKRNWKAAIEAFAGRVRQGLAFRVRAFASAHGLTSRELEVLELFVGDHDRDEIAERLEISPWTVQIHLRAILGATSLTRLAEVRRSIRRGEGNV